VDAEGDPCEAPCARSVDYGVGGTVPTFTAGPIGEEVEVTDGGAELEESATSEDYVFAVTVTDKSGNADTRWATNPDDNDSGDVSTTTDEPEDDAATQFFGWDATAPEIELTAGPDDMEANPDEATATIGFSDSSELPAGPSGFLADPVQLKTERYLPAGVTCRDAEDAYSTQSCTDDNGFVPSDGDWDMPSAVPQEGYFRFTAFVADAAGNVSEELTFWILYDTSDPDVGGISAPSTIEGGASATFSADLEDNVDLGSLQPFVGFAGLFLNFPHTGGSNGLTVFNDYSPTSLIDEDGGTVTFASFVRSIEDASGSGGVPPGAFTEADQMLYLVRDMAGHQLRFVQLPWKGAPDDGVCAGQNCFDRVVGIGANVDGPDDPAFTLLSDLNADGLNPGDALELPADATGRDPAPFAFNWGSWRVLPWAAGVSVCNNADEEDCSTAEDNTTIAMEAVVQGPRGSFATPFAAVWFVYLNGEGNLQFISTASATVTDNTIEETRTVRYRATWDATDLRVRPAGDPGTTYTVYAVGITADGDALLSVGQEVIVEGN
jgi:hypothetical protein